jgi:dihydroorotase-like cyclic amidohydrolase
VLSYYVPDHHRDALWAAMEAGVVDMLSSDHAPHTREEKELGWTDAWAAHTGTPGIQYQLPLMIDAVRNGRLSFDRMVDLVSTAPADVFGLPYKGRIAPGCDADIALLDLDHTWTITNDSVLSKIGWTPYSGREITGAVQRTMVRGTDVWKDGRVVGQPGHGRMAAPRMEGRV